LKSLFVRVELTISQTVNTLSSPGHWALTSIEQKKRTKKVRKKQNVKEVGKCNFVGINLI